MSTIASTDSLSRESPRTSRNSPSSRQSFATALTSSKQGTPVSIENSDLRATSPTPLGLRKSVSVDSFVQYGRDSVPQAAPRPSRGHTSPGYPISPVHVSDATTRLRQENEIIQRSLRLRNSIADSGQLVIGDSDVERSEPLLLLGDRARRMSSRAIDRHKTLIRGGELPLPSRTPTLSTVSTISSVSGVSLGARELPPHRLQSASSMQSMSRRSINTALSNPTGRARSGSLGVYVTQSGKPILVNTRVTTVSAFGLVL